MDLAVIDAAALVAHWERDEWLRGLIAGGHAAEHATPEELHLVADVLETLGPFGRWADGYLAGLRLGADDLADRQEERLPWPSP